MNEPAADIEFHLSSVSDIRIHDRSDSQRGIGNIGILSECEPENVIGRKRSAAAVPDDKSYIHDCTSSPMISGVRRVNETLMKSSPLSSAENECMQHPVKLSPR